MQLARISRTSDFLGRYYTRSDVGSILVDALCETKPEVVIDLGAGCGALIGVATERWREAKFIAVDIDKDAGSKKFVGHKGLAFSHHHADALNPNLAQLIGLGMGGVDVALCNPPYVRPKWKNHFSEILEDAGLSGVLNVRDVPAPLLFIAQNLRLLRPGGKLGVILPDGMVSGQKFEVMRQALLLQHSLERVIELPRHIFAKTDAKAHIVVLTKGGPTRGTVKVQQLQMDGELSAPIDLAMESAGSRLDYSFLSKGARVSKRSSFVLGTVVVAITRGSHSSAEIGSLAHPVFHTSDFSLVSPSAFVSKRVQWPSSTVLAEAGDILIARVGRNLEQKVCLVEKGPIAISDSVFLIRVLPSYRARTFEFLRSNAGRTALEASAHGVSAKFLSKADVLQLKIV